MTSTGELTQCILWRFTSSEFERISMIFQRTHIFAWQAVKSCRAAWVGSRIQDSFYFFIDGSLSIAEVLGMTAGHSSSLAMKETLQRTHYLWLWILEQISSTSECLLVPKAKLSVFIETNSLCAFCKTPFGPTVGWSSKATMDWNGLKTGQTWLFLKSDRKSKLSRGRAFSRTSHLG